jgi:hypothetical protein
MQPDAAHTPVSLLISAVTRRQWWRQLAVCGLLGAAVFLLLVLLDLRHVPRSVSLTLALGASTAAMLTLRSSITRQAAAAAIERRFPSCRNLVISAEELQRHPERATARVADRVIEAASAAVQSVSASAVVPWHHIALALMAALVVVVVGTSLPVRSMRSAMTPLAADVPPRPLATSAITVVIEPPAYVRQPVSRLINPTRIDVLEGSRIRFALADGWRVRFGGGESTVDIVAHESGYFAIEPIERHQRSLLIPLNVQPDRAPTVRITAPGKDLLLPDGSRNIPLTVSAVDDLGLRSLEVRYTKVSGSGEHFEFVEGTLPTTVRRTSSTDWQADASLALRPLRLGPGDSLVYRAVARDQRPGETGAATSDTYFIEIAGPGQVALEGVDMPPELDRYAMSQQMIVVKIERLQRAQTAMTRAELAEAAASLAAEQRTVRANFIFLLGGHVEDEEEEAARSHEIQEGRLENSARREINSAISHMTRVEQRLTAIELGRALPPARAAVEALQRAFGRSRYLLRSLAVRGRLDPSRRLAGELAGAGDWRRSADVSPPDRARGARVVFAMLLASLDALRAGQDPDPRRLLEIGELALKIDPTAEVWQDIAGEITRARDAASLERVVARVATEGWSTALARPGLSTLGAPLTRAFREERRK